jgi:hypothetical protein
MFCDKHNAELRSLCISPGLAPARRHGGLAVWDAPQVKEARTRMIDFFTPRLKVKTRTALFDAVGGALPAKLS